MSKQADINVVQGDKNYSLKFTLEDSNGVAIDLTSATSILFVVQKVGASAIKFSGSMTKGSPATNGQVTYVVQANDFDQSGLYYAQVRVVYGSTGEETFNNILIRADARLPL